MNDQLITPNDTNQSPASPSDIPQNQIPPTEPKKSGTTTLILVSVLMLLLGCVVGYFVTKTYFPTTETITVDVPVVTEAVTDATTSSGVDNNWKLESEQAVDGYLGYFSVAGPTLAGVIKPKTCDPGTSTVKCTPLKALLTTKFNNYLTCLVDSPQANNVESGLIINYNPVIGGQDAPKSHEIINAIQSGEKVTVITKLNYDQPEELNFYLEKENGKWLINATDISKKIISSEYGCSQYETK